MDQIVSLGIIRNEEEAHAKKVLSAAAMTYVAATAVAVLELVRLLLDFHKQRLIAEKICPKTRGTDSSLLVNDVLKFR